jgi:hypothetical protein
MAAMNAGPINANRNLRAALPLLPSTRLFVISASGNIAFAMFNAIKMRMIIKIICDVYSDFSDSFER